MSVILVLTIVVGLLCFGIFWAYTKRSIVRGRPSGTGSIRVTDPILARGQPKDFFQSMMPIARPALQSPSVPWWEPKPNAPEEREGFDGKKEVSDKNKEVVNEKKEISSGKIKNIPGASLSPSKMVGRADGSKPTVFYTHKHLVPLAAQLAEEVWPARQETEAARIKSLSRRDFSPEQISALKPHYAALRLFIVLDASFSADPFQKEHRAFHELLYYHVVKKCGSRELARRISAGVRKYVRNGALTFGEKNGKIVLARLNGIFWGGVLAERPGSFAPDDAKSFHAAFSMACDFTVHYDSVLGMLEKHCGVKLARPAFTLVLPRDSEFPFSPESAPCENVSGTHHDLLDWIEDTDAFQRLYDDTSGGGIDACYFCGGDPGMAPSVTLLNGWRVHERCFGILTERLAKLRTVQEARKLFKASPNLLCAHRLVNVYWPDLPPDWENRRETIFARAEGSCENCGKSDEKLEIRRVIPLEKRGSHSNDNFLCLCPACSEELSEHQGARDGAVWQSLYRRKLETIGSAMSGERKLIFTYNEKETRVIFPKEWVKRRGYWLIKGYCYLHNDERLFNPRKMTDLKVPQLRPPAR